MSPTHKDGERDEHDAANSTEGQRHGRRCGGPQHGAPGGRSRRWSARPSSGTTSSSTASSPASSSTSSTSRAGDPLVATLLAYATFAVGFVTRPLGGVIFGHFGDRIGRKTMLIMTLMIMGVSTLLIGLVPTYAQIGVAAPLLLLLLRVLQGIGLGGEWGGAVLMAYEYAPKEQRGFYALAAADRPGDRPVPGLGRRRAALVAAHRRAVPRLGLARRLPDLGRAGAGRPLHPAQHPGDAGVRGDQGARTRRCACRSPT